MKRFLPQRREGRKGVARGLTAALSLAALMGGCVVWDVNLGGVLRVKTDVTYTDPAWMPVVEDPAPAVTPATVSVTNLVVSVPERR